MTAPGQPDPSERDREIAKDVVDHHRRVGTPIDYIDVADACALARWEERERIAKRMDAQADAGQGTPVETILRGVARWCRLRVVAPEYDPRWEDPASYHWERCTVPPDPAQTTAPAPDQIVRDRQAAADALISGVAHAAAARIAARAAQTAPDDGGGEFSEPTERDAAFARALPFWPALDAHGRFCLLHAISSSRREGVDAERTRCVTIVQQLKDIMERIANEVGA